MEYQEILKPVGAIASGLLFAGVGLYIRQLNTKLIREGVKVRGKVIGFVDENEQPAVNLSDTGMFPVIQYENDQGQTTTLNLNPSGTGKSLGETIEVYVMDSDDSYNAMANNEFMLYYFHWIFILLGIVIVIIGIVLLSKLF